MMTYRWLPAGLLALAVSVSGVCAQAPQAGKTAEQEGMEGLAVFYSVQLMTAECGLSFKNGDGPRLAKIVKLIETGSGKSPAVLAELKGRVLVELKTNQDKVCAEGKYTLAALGGVLDQMEKDIAESTGTPAPSSSSPTLVSQNRQVPSASAARSEGPRNPFGVADVKDPYGQDVRQFAARYSPSGGDRDANARQWATAVSAGQPGTLDGDWMGRWEGGAGSTAKVQVKGDRFYAIYSDGKGRMKGSTWIIEAVFEGNDRLVGRWVQVGDPRDTGPFVGRIVNDERIDGIWSWNGSGRWDFRRRLN